jgi:hypothetical protein
MDSTRKIIKNGFRVYKSIKSQKLNLIQRRLTGLRPGAKDLRRGAITGVKNPDLLPSAPGRNSSALWRQSLLLNGNLRILSRKSLFHTRKHLFWI